MALPDCTTLNTANPERLVSFGTDPITNMMWIEIEDTSNPARTTAIAVDLTPDNEAALLSYLNQRTGDP